VPPPEEGYFRAVREQSATRSRRPASSLDERCAAYGPHRHASCWERKIGRNSQAIAKEVRGGLPGRSAQCSQARSSTRYGRDREISARTYLLGTRGLRGGAGGSADILARELLERVRDLGSPRTAGDREFRQFTGTSAISRPMPVPGMKWSRRRGAVRSALKLNSGSRPAPRSKAGPSGYSAGGQWGRPAAATCPARAAYLAI